MKTGLSLQEMAGELEAQAKAKQDYVADTREMTYLTTPPDTDTPREGATATDTELHLPEGLGEFRVLEHAHRQVAERLEIPKKYYDRIRHDHPALLDHNVNTLFRERPDRRMVRCFDWGGGDKTARAFVSDRYRRRDNIDLVEAVLPVLGEIPDVQFVSCALTPERLYIKAVTPRVQAEVKKGDVVQAGVVLSNSEVGDGALWVRPLVFRLICLNGMIVPDAALRGYHVGKRVGDDADNAFRVYSDETVQADDKAFFMKVIDVTKAAVDQARFEAVVAQLRDAAERKSAVDPIEGVERLTNRFALGEGESKSVLHHLVNGGDLTAYGYLNAVTRASQDVEDYQRATELETVGGEILGMKPAEWKALAA